MATEQKEKVPVFCLGNLFHGYSGEKNPMYDSIVEVMGDLVDNIICEGIAFDENNPRIVPALLGGKSPKNLAVTVQIYHYSENLRKANLPVRILVEEVELPDAIPDGFDRFDTDDYLWGIYEQTKCVKVYLFAK